MERYTNFKDFYPYYLSEHSNKTTKLNEEKEQNNTKDKLNENVNIPKEQGGPKGPEPTRYGDWEKAGRCSDF